MVEPATGDVDDAVTRYFVAGPAMKSTVAVVALAPPDFTAAPPMVAVNDALPRELGAVTVAV
jgi:hypothetical protein